MALKGVRVLEFSGLAPVPFCGMVLADFGADVIRIDRTHSSREPFWMSRGKRSLQVNMKSPKGVEVLRTLIRGSDVLLDPFRPGVLERLGLGPEIFLHPERGVNKRLIYARLSGYGQTGPLALKAGHDINYLALSGVLSQLGRAKEPPMFPVNLLADFAGGGLNCAFGVLAALFERERSGLGQVVDVSMTEGAGYLGTFLLKARAAGIQSGSRGTNLLDGGAPFYEVYETKDGKYMAVGSIEPQFFSALVRGLQLPESIQSKFTSSQMDSSLWPEMKQLFTETFKTKTRGEWTKVFGDHKTLDACVEPVLEPTELLHHPQHSSRGSYFQVKGEETRGGEGEGEGEGEVEVEPSPAPLLSRTPAAPSKKGDVVPGTHTREVLSQFGFSNSDIDSLFADGSIDGASPPLKASL